MKTKRSSLLLIALISFNLAPLIIASESSAFSTNWQPLIGNWTAEGTGAPGNGAGVFSFGFDLQNRVIIRKSHTEYPAADGHPAFAHDDLMIVYQDRGPGKLRADYFDNEGHVIRYTGAFSNGGRRLTFLSDPEPSQPTFRLTYDVSEANGLTIKFEIAPPNAPAEFKTYVQGSARKS